MFAGLIALEDRRILGKGDFLGGVLGRLPVGIVGAALDIVDHLAVQFERHAQFDQRLDLALAGEDAVARRRDSAQMAGADRRERGAARTGDIDDAPPGEVALQGARRLLLELRPGHVGDRRQLAVQIIH